MKKIIYPILITVVVWLLLLVCIPRQSKTLYNYEQGRPWKYMPLIASFDFPIYKTSQDIQREKDSILQTFKPFFNRDDTIGDIEIQNFVNDYNRKAFQAVSGVYARDIVKRLRQMYATGILMSADYDSLMEKQVKEIHIINGNEASSYETKKLYSIRTAYLSIMNTDSSKISRDILMRCNLNKYIVPNLFPDRHKTEEGKQDLMNSVSAANGMVVSGQRIIDKGEIVNARQKQILDSYTQEINRREASKNNFWQQTLSQGLFVFILLSFILFYLSMFRKHYLLSPHKIILILSLLGIFPIITYLMVRYNIHSIYMLPYAIVPIFLSVFLDTRTASMSLLITLLLSALCLKLPFEFLILEFYMGSTAIYMLKELTQRSQIIRTAFFVTLSGLILQFSYDWFSGISIMEMDIWRFIYICINGFLLLFAYPLMYLVERIFGFTSNVTLIELTNINNPLLLRMSKVAQGTFNHSMQVSNLASEVANKIGAKAQLVRTGALYHDIGKMENPSFFTENQTGVNPHDNLQAEGGLSPEERSAQIIIGHVTGGIRMAEKNHLPKDIIDFIATHHGRSQVKYFFIQWQNKHPNEQPNEELFTYPGPNPFTKEQAILMMCDAVEATSRSLKEYTEESISKLVNGIVDAQVAGGYFKECPITFKDIAIAKRVLMDSLKTIYHTRISYPELKKAEPDSKPSRHSSLLGGSFYHSRKHK